MVGHIWMLGLQILCQDNFEHNQHLLNRGIMLGFSPKKGVIKLCIMRAQLKEHSLSTKCMYMPVASSSSYTMLSEGPESSNIDSEQVWSVSLCPLANR